MPSLAQLYFISPRVAPCFAHPPRSTGIRTFRPLRGYEEENNYVPFVQYMLGVVVAAYRDFSDRVETLVTSGLSKPERVAELIKNTYGEITKSQIMEKCPDISRITVERALSELLASESIIREAKREMQELLKARQNVEQFYGDDLKKEREAARQQRKEL